jgi:cytochrome c peroxidase
MKTSIRLILALLVMLFVIGCDPFENAVSNQIKLELPQTPFEYQVTGVTDHVPTVGRVMFYDPRLSINNSISCGSCHKQSLAFSDHTALSRGFENRITQRNSMPIQNIISQIFIRSDTSTFFVSHNQPGGYLPGVEIQQVGNPQFSTLPTALFWDGREHDLKSMVMQPITNHIEMGIHNLDELAAKLSSLPEYPVLFENAFGKGVQITKDHIAISLSAFLLSIRSRDSKLDNSLDVASGVRLSAIEEQGRDLFFNTFKCNGCHEKSGFSDIGLELSPSDPGLSNVTGLSTDRGKFKVPSLRNVQLTAPYMHDGRFRTLEEVLDHYSGGVKNSPNLDSRLKQNNGQAIRMNISKEEKQAIIAFLNTLTDYKMISDPKWSNPFVKK